MAFKANNDDTRQSLSFKLRKLLQIEAKGVLCSDVYVHDDEFVSPQDLIKNSDIIILATPHKEYANLALKGKPVVDVWNFYGKGGSF
jgi:UDP-N-acetyl-D-mannosaminuronic acid dehydrogenase